jgi:hypothetical protein
MSVLEGRGNRGKGKITYKALRNIYSSPNIARMVKSKRMRWVGHVTPMARRDVYMGVWWRNLRERDHLEDHGIDVKIILRWIFRKWDGRA